MQVLVVDEEIPAPLNTGKRIRTFNLLKYLAKDHDITFICRSHEGVTDNDPLPLEKAGIKVIHVDHPIRKKGGFWFYFALLLNLFSKYPYTVSSHYSRKLVKKIKILQQENSFDLIHCEWTPYTINIVPFIKNISAVVDAHNVESLIWMRNYEVENNVLKKYYVYLQWKKMLSFEKKAFSLYERIVTVSEPDKNIITDWLPEKKVDVVDNGVDVDYFHPDGSAVIPYSIVFTGSLDWRPNVSGLLYFLEEVFPVVQRFFPETRCTLVGRNPMRALEDKVRVMDNVILTGTVADVRPYMNEGAVYIVPLLIGGGSRLKILEAMSMEKAIVSTSIGAEGLNVAHQENLLLADTIESFAKAIGKVFRDSDLRKRLGKAGRKLVEAEYQWKVLARNLEQSWIKAAE